MFAGFGWDACDKGGWYNIVKGKIKEISQLGIDYLWLPPPSQSIAPQGYLQSELYDVETPFGSQEDLKALTGALKEEGIIPMVDIVLNHRCAQRQDENGTWNIFTYASSQFGTGCHLLALQCLFGVCKALRAWRGLLNVAPFVS
jgi:alpha-amylase